MTYPVTEQTVRLAFTCPSWATENEAAVGEMIRRMETVKHKPKAIGPAGGISNGIPHNQKSEAFQAIMRKRANRQERTLDLISKGITSRTSLLDAGLPESTFSNDIAQLVRDGQVIRLQPGLYAPASALAVIERARPILEKACEGTGVIVEEVIGQSRCQNVYKVRKAAIRALHDDGFSIKEICLAIGGRDRKTITNTLKKKKDP